MVAKLNLIYDFKATRALRILNLRLKIGQLSCSKDMWINLEFFTWEIYITDEFLGCFKTAVKLNLFDDALNLALYRLNLTFSIEIFRSSATFAKIESGICLRTWVNLLLKALKLTFQIKFVAKFKPKNSCNKLKINKFADRNFKFCRLNALVWGS